MHLESVSLLVHYLSLFCHHSLIDSFWKMKALTELILTFDFVQRCSRIIRIIRISVIEMLILDVLIVSKAYRQYILPHSNFFTYYFSHLKYAHGPPGCWALHGLLFHKVNSVQEACAKCFAVHILRFEILQIKWKKMKQRTSEP